MNPNQNLNLNQAECIKQQLNFGNSVYYNICAGTTQSVPWGTADWTMAVVLIALTGVGLSLLVSMAIDMLRDYR